MIHKLEIPVVKPAEPADPRTFILRYSFLFVLIEINKNEKLCISTKL